MTADTSRQMAVLDRIVNRISTLDVYIGAILVGSLAAGDFDDMSDVDLIVVVREGRFPEGWASRSGLEGGDSIAAWDESAAPSREIGAHKWLTGDLVLVEALLTCPSAGVRLAPPSRIVAGPPELDRTFLARPTISRAELRVADSSIEAAYDQLKTAVRAVHRPEIDQSP